MEMAQQEKYALEVEALMVVLVGGELLTRTITSKTAKTKYPSLTFMGKKPDMKDLEEAAALEMGVLEAQEEVSFG